MAVSTTVINTVARRLRDIANLAYPRAVLVRYVDHAQRVIAAYTKSVVTTTSFNATTLHAPFSPVYAPITPTAWSSIESVRVDGKTIGRIEPWTDLVHNDPEWFGTHGNRYIAWATIGKDLFVLYPIVDPLPDVTVQIDYVPAIPSTILDNGSNDIVLPDDLIPLLEDLVECLGLLKGRRYSEASDPIARFQQTLETVGRVYQVQQIAGRV